MSLLNLNNFFNLITGRGREAKSVKDTDVLALGRQDFRSSNGYQSVGLRAKALKEYITKDVKTGGLNEVSIKLSEHPVEQVTAYYDSTDEEKWNDFYTLFPSPFQVVPLFRLSNGNLAQCYYPQIMMPDGTYLFEVYDSEGEHNPATSNNGYWVAMKEINGRLEPVGELPMSDVFWDYWYDQVYMDHENNRVYLFGYQSLFRGDRVPNHGRVVLEYSDANGLTLVSEDVLDFGGITVSQHFQNELGYTVPGTQNMLQRYPEYEATNTWYGMRDGAMKGIHWVVPGGAYDQNKVIGFNVFTGQVVSIDIATDPDFLAITNFEGILNWQDYHANSELGFVVQYGDDGLVDNVSNAGLTAFWSKWKTDPTKLCWLRYRKHDGRFSETGGLFTGAYTYQFHGKNLTLVEIIPDRTPENGQVAKLTRINLDSDGSQPIVRFKALPKSLQPELFSGWSGAFGLMTLYLFPNSVIFGHWFDTRAEGHYGENILMVWEDSKDDFQVIHSSGFYISHCVDGNLIAKDTVNFTNRNAMAYTVLRESFNNIKF